MKRYNFTFPYYWPSKGWLQLLLGGALLAPLTGHGQGYPMPARIAAKGPVPTVTNSRAAKAGRAVVVSPVAFSPARNLPNVSAGSTLAVTYSAALQAAAASHARVFSAQRGGQLNRNGSAVASVNGNVLSVDPATNFRPGETIGVSLPAAILSSDGSPALPYVYQFTAAVSSGGGQFVAPATNANPSVGGGPLSNTLADVDGDGDLDLLAASYTTNSVSVRLNNGSGSFSGGSDPAVGAGPYAVVTGDVDGDGDLDLLTANQNSNDVSVRLNNGSGSFAAGSDLSMGNSLSGLALGDFDGDGDLDLVASGQYSNVLHVRLNNGSGVFAGGSSLALSAGAYGVSVGDVDGDGDLDLLAAAGGTFGAFSNQVAIYRNNGAATFTADQSVTVGSFTTSVALGDVDSDGDLDFVAACYNSSTLSLRLNNGMGSFSGGADIGGAGGDYSVALSDVDGDGDLDLLSAGTNASLRLNNGTGSFSIPAGTGTIGLGAASRSIATGDIDQDGDVDFVSADFDFQTGSTVSVRLNQPAAPTLSGTTRSSAPVGGTLTLTGANLTGTSLITFSGNAGNTVASGFVVNAAGTQITGVVVPSGTISGPVTVTNNVATSNGTSFTVVPSAGALALGGSNDYVDFGTAYAGLPSGNADFTLEMWYYNPGGLSGDRWLAWWGSVGTNTAAIIGYEGATGRVKFNHYAVGNDLTSNVVLPVGQWSHLAVAYKGATRQAHLMLNGVYQETLTYTQPLAIPATGVFQLGTFNSSAMFSANGMLDEVRVWNVTLCPAQVAARMGCTLNGSETGLRAYFPFTNAMAGAAGDNASLTSLADANGGPAGTLINFALNGSSSNWVAQAAPVSSTCNAAPACPVPTVTLLAPASGNAGTSVTVTGTNFSNVLGVQFNGTSAPGFVVNSATSLTVTVPAGASTGAVSVVTPNGTGTSAGSFTVTNNLTVSTTATIPAGTYTSVTVTGTGAATLSGNITVNGPFVVQTGGSLNTNCRVLSGTGSFTLQAGATLSICDAAGITATDNSGAVRLSGARSFSPGASYVYNGTVAQSTGNGLPAQVRSLASTNSQALTLSQPLAIVQTLTVGGAGNVVLNGQALTLLSNATGTALVVNSSTGVVTGGTATMQRHLTAPATRVGYRHYSSPVSGNTLADLATATFTPVFNADFNTSPTPNLVTPFPTVLGYDQSRLATANNNQSDFDKGWYSPSSGAGNTPDAFETGRGYSVQLAGRERVDFTGTLNTGTYPLALARTSGASAVNSGWHMVGNPYPAPLDFSLVAPADRANLDAAMYVFESNSAYGGQYRAYVNTVGNPLIGSGQGFWVRVSENQTSGTLTFRNSQRLTSYGTQVAVRRGAADLRPLLQLSLAGAAGAADDLYVYAQAGATAGLDAAFDAVKMANPSGLNLAAVAASGEELAIDGRASLGVATVVPLRVAVHTAGTYTFTLATLANLEAGTTVYLRDALTGTRTLLKAGSTCTFTLAAPAATGRFSLELGSAAAPLSTSSTALATGLSLYPNPAQARATVQLPPVAGTAKASLTLSDALGRPVLTRTLALPADGARAELDLSGLPRGVYALRVTAGSQTTTRRLVVE